MKTINTLLCAVALVTVGCSTLKKTTPPLPPLQNSVDSMSYSFGINIGTGLSKDLDKIPGGKINKDKLIKGFAEALKGDTTIIDAETAKTYFTNYIEEQQKIMNEKLKKEGENFLNENKKQQGVQTTPSGLQYIVLKQTDGNKPQATDKVKVHYTGKTMDGKVFDSSVDRGQPTEFLLNQVIPGWTEGVQLMAVGSKYKFFIPYNLAYGERGIPQAGIPPFAPLIFEVELLEILNK